MRRTQLYLDDHLWGALHSRARRDGTTISELVRQAVREQYLGSIERRKTAMKAFVGTRKSRPALEDSSEREVRNLRRGVRLDRLGER